jgi:hypothetical protein
MAFRDQEYAVFQMQNWKTKIHYAFTASHQQTLHWAPLIYSESSHSSYLKIRFNISLPPTTKFSKWSTHGLINSHTVRISCLTSACCTTQFVNILLVYETNMLFSSFFTRDKTLTVVPAIFLAHYAVSRGELIPMSLSPRCLQLYYTATHRNATEVLATLHSIFSHLSTPVLLTLTFQTQTWVYAYDEPSGAN